MSLFSDDDSPTSSVDSAESSAEGDGRRKRTIAERLEAQYAKDQNLGREQQTAFERRQQTRREYMERVGLSMCPPTCLCEMRVALLHCRLTNHDRPFPRNASVQTGKIG